MNKLFLLLLIPILAFGQATTGYHRVNQLLTRGTSGVTAQIVPNGSIYVTNTVTGATATIYSDPGLSIQITSGLVTSDKNGNYDYYIPLNYCVNEAVSSPGQGSYTTKNICVNGGGTGVVGSGSSGQIPYYAANGTTVSPTSALPNGITATTQTTGDNTTQVATDAFVLANAPTVNFAAPPVLGSTTPNVVNGTNGNFSGTLSAGTTVAINSGTLAAAVALIPSGGTLIVGGPLTVSSSLSTPDTVGISVVAGGSINISSGQTLTINGPFSAPLVSVFTGSGTVSFSRTTVGDIYAGWWYSGTGAWDSALTSAIAACSGTNNPLIDSQPAVVAWCDLPASLTTVGTVTLLPNTWLRPVSQEGGIGAAAGFGTWWTHYPVVAGVDTIKGTNAGNIKIQGIYFESKNSGGYYPESAIYLNGSLGCRIKGIGSSASYTLATMLMSGLQDCRMDDWEINGPSGSPNPAGIRFLGPESTPAGSLSTTTDFYHLTMNGGDVVGVMFDGDACLGCNFYSPEVETETQTAYNIAKGNTVDLYSPYVENVPSTDIAYGVFRIGKDYLTANAATYVNIYGGEVYGTNSSYVNPIAFDLGPAFDLVTLKGGAYGRVGTFQNISNYCVPCKLTVDNVSAYMSTGFGTVDSSNANQIDFRAGNYFTGPTPAGIIPAVSRQYGLAANAPLYYNSPGQLYWSTDQGLLVWDGPTQAWLGAGSRSITGGLTITETTYAGWTVNGGAYGGSSNKLSGYVDSAGNGHMTATNTAYIGAGNGPIVIGGSGSNAVNFNYDPIGGTPYGGSGGVNFGDGANHKTLWIDSYGVRHNLAGSGNLKPTASAGTIVGTNEVGYVSGLSAATTLTITFANGGWAAWASCPSLTTSTGVSAYPSAQSNTAVTVTFASSFTGTLYYGCGGN